MIDRKGHAMADKAKTWQMIHDERRALLPTLEGLTPEQWAAPSLCAGWSVHLVAAHILSGAEQTGPKFLAGMVASGFRFNALMDREAHRLGTLAPAEIVERLRARTTTSNHPPAPAMAMLGEVVVHGEDIRRPLGLPGAASGEATVACLDMLSRSGFPVGGRKRVQGLRLVAADLDWSRGEGPEVRGPGASLVLAVSGRAAGLEGLAGDGLPTLRARLAGG